MSFSHRMCERKWSARYRHDIAIASMAIATRAGRSWRITTAPFTAPRIPVRRRAGRCRRLSPWEHERRSRAIWLRGRGCKLLKSFSHEMGRFRGFVKNQWVTRRFISRFFRVRRLRPRVAGYFVPSKPTLARIRSRTKHELRPRPKILT